jgi:hypothetical protein
LDFAKTDGPAPKAERYRLVASRVETHGARIKRFRLAKMDALARLESPRRAPTIAR